MGGGTTEYGACRGISGGISSSPSAASTPRASPALRCARALLLRLLAPPEDLKVRFAAMLLGDVCALDDATLAAIWRAAGERCLNNMSLL